MTVNVVLMVPDGIVVAADSLATSFQPLQGVLTIDQPIKCGTCGNAQKIPPIQMPPIPIPGRSTPLASKIFYIGNYGLTFFGPAAINGRSLFNHVMAFQKQGLKEGMILKDIADGLARQFNAAMIKDPQFNGLAPGREVGGFQICGYDPDDVDYGHISVVKFCVGQPPHRDDRPQQYAISVTGQIDVIQKLVGPTQLNFNSLTVPDAIDYARFLVQTTSDYQRFSNAVPTVGGPTTIALITKWIGFRWVERQKILDDDTTTRLNIGKIAQEIKQMCHGLPENVRRALKPETPDKGA